MAASPRRAPARGADRGRTSPRRGTGRASTGRSSTRRTTAAGSSKARSSSARSSNGRRQARGALPSLSLRALVVALLVLAVVLALMAAGPYADYTAARDRVEDLAVEHEGLTEAVEALESEQARLEDPRALEEEARSELGLTRPGEIPYIVVNPPEATAAPPDPDAAAVPADEPNLLERVLDTVTGWFASDEGVEGTGGSLTPGG